MRIIYILTYTLTYQTILCS